MNNWNFCINGNNNGVECVFVPKNIELEINSLLGVKGYYEEYLKLFKNKLEDEMRILRETNLTKKFYLATVYRTER